MEELTLFADVISTPKRFFYVVFNTLLSCATQRHFVTLNASSEFGVQSIVLFIISMHNSQCPDIFYIKSFSCAKISFPCHQSMESCAPSFYLRPHHVFVLEPPYTS